MTKCGYCDYCEATGDLFRQCKRCEDKDQRGGEAVLSDSGRVLGDCRHGFTRSACPDCSVIDNLKWSVINLNTEVSKLRAENDRLRAACQALPLDKTFEDAADFKDNAVAFMRAMDLAREALKGGTP